MGLGDLPRIGGPVCFKNGLLLRTPLRCVVNNPAYMDSNDAFPQQEERSKVSFMDRRKHGLFLDGTGHKLFRSLLYPEQYSERMAEFISFLHPVLWSRYICFRENIIIQASCHRRYH